MKKMPLTLALVALASVLFAQTTYLHCGNLIDGKSNKVQKEMTVIITQNKITDAQ